MIENYMAYLMFLNEKLERFFKIQKPYIFCKAGCSKCCENAQFPYSQIEFEYIKTGFNLLPYNIQKEIKKNVEDVLKLKQQTDKKPFTYKCPFLINNMCSVYNYRGIICRTFGLMNVDVEGDGSNIPFCAYDGLNYSNVFDPEKRIISKAMYEKLGVKEEPMAFNIRYEFLTEDAFAKGFGFKFGPIKPLIDWFEE